MVVLACTGVAGIGCLTGEPRVFRRVQVGMTRAEVQGVFGRDSDGTSGTSFGKVTTVAAHYWYAEKGTPEDVLVVYFDEDDKVKSRYTLAAGNR
jgi:outer membrane protein assembly factor BamE (lipoprotein component of BamABCDE complex)